MFLRFILSTLAIIISVTANARPVARPNARSAARPNARAAVNNVLSSDFKAAARGVPSALIGFGYQNFGRLNLAEFINIIDNASVYGASTDTIGAANDDGRITARCTGSNQKIIVNKEMWTRYPHTREMLALHEFLGLAGFDDGEYRISHRMWLLSMSETQSTLNRDEIAGLASEISAYAGIQFAGGVVGVGGGGESGTIFVRTQRTQKAMQAIQQATDENSRAQAVEDFNYALHSNATVTYLQKMKPSTQRALAKRVQEQMAHPVCLVHAGTCPMPDPRATTCSCGSETDGIVIYPY